MTPKQEAQLREMITPIADTVRQSFVSSLILRCDVRLCMAIDNGAEPEDFGEVISQALESATPLTAKFLDELGDIENAKKLGAQQ